MNVIWVGFMSHTSLVFLLQLKKTADSEAVKSEVVGQAYLEEAAMKLFLKADNDDRSAVFNK